MQIVTPNPTLVSCFGTNVFNSPENLAQILWQGIQVITATDFQSYVARKFSADHLLVCGEFFRNFLGQYKQIGVDYLSARIRLFNLVGSDGIEGVELSILEHKVELLKISHVCGTQVSTVIKTWQV